MNKDVRSRLRDLPSPEPTAGVEVYRRERELALAASAEKRANYDRFCAYQPGAPVDFLPVKLDMENVSRCNFRCTMCVVSEWEKGRRSHDMSLAQFKALIDEQIGLLEIKLQGIGEPLLQGADLFEMIKYARARHIWVRTTTNASLLHLHDNYRQLIDADPNEVQVSVDGADKVVFESIRRGSNFERVVENCKLINGYCRERGVARTKMWTVVQERNAHQLKALVNLAAEMGFTHQAFALNLSDWGLSEWRTLNDQVSVQDSLDAEALWELIPYGADRGVVVRFWNVNEKYRLGDRSTLCPWPFERAFVSSDLRVVPCCYIGNPDVFQIDEPISADGGFSAIWRGKTYADFRRAHLEGDLPPICQGCYSI